MINNRYNCLKNFEIKSKNHEGRAGGSDGHLSFTNWKKRSTTKAARNKKNYNKTIPSETKEKIFMNFLIEFSCNRRFDPTHGCTVINSLYDNLYHLEFFRDFGTIIQIGVNMDLATIFFLTNNRHVDL
jgi:hypothetical protein